MFFVIPGMDPGSQEIPLEADAGADVGEIYWFVDGRFHSSSGAQERVWLMPSPGRHTVRALDASGRGDSIDIQVRMPG